MGPQIPLHFFMTRLMFMDQAKVDSLKAKKNRDVQIITDNPAILPESMAKSLPPIPFPPAAPESPKSVEGWKGIRVGGWLCIGGKNSNAHPPTVPDLNGLDTSSSVPASATTTATAEVAKLSLADDNDDTEMTEESNITSITEASASATATAAPMEKRRQLFPTNSKRNLRLSSNNSGNSGGGAVGSKRNLTKKGGSIKSIARPILKKRNSSKSKQIGGTGDNNGSSPSNSGAEEDN